MTFSSTPTHQPNLPSWGKKRVFSETGSFTGTKWRRYKSVFSYRGEKKNFNRLLASSASLRVPPQLLQILLDDGKCIKLT